MPVVGRVVAEPDQVARHVLKVISRDRATETHVPRWYRVGTVSQGVVPGVIRSVVSRFAHGKERA
jgi:hypothetical protein